MKNSNKPIRKGQKNYTRNDGYVKLYRDDYCFLKEKPQYLIVYCYLLCHVLTKPSFFKKIHLEAGEGIFGRNVISQKTGLSVGVVRNALDYLEEYGFILRRVSESGKFTICHILDRECADNSTVLQPAEKAQKETFVQQIEESEEAETTKNATANQTEIGQKSDTYYNKEQRNNIYCATEDIAQHENSLVLKGRKKAIKGSQAEAFNKFWDTFDDKRGKMKAIDVWAGIPSSEYKHIFYSAEQYAQERQSLLSKGNTPKMAEGWLADHRWEDYEMPKERVVWVAPRSVQQTPPQKEYTEEDRQKALAFLKELQEKRKAERKRQEQEYMKKLEEKKLS